MAISNNHYRPFGNTGLTIPPIVFRGDVLDNAARVIPDQTKRVICGEWFQCVRLPVFIDIDYDVKRNAVLEQLGRILKRLDIAPDDVVINLGLKCLAESRRAIGRDAILAWYDKACKLLGDLYVPKLVTVDGREKQVIVAASQADRANCLEAALGAIRAIAELKSAKRIAGVGIRCSDWRFAKQLSDATTLDFITLVGGFTILRHPPELIAFLTSLAQRQIPVIAAGVFHGGFLVGGPQFDGRSVNPDDLASQSLIAWRKAFTSLCHGHGVRPAHACIQFALSAPAVAAVSLSTSRANRVAENVAAVANRVPDALWESFKEEGLLEEGYSFLG
jgi:D-threo-aldose 1-dehydrogenase